MEKNTVVLSGIGTDVGKTVVSAIVCEALQSYYWKPVQAGDLENSDSIKVDRLTSNTTILEEKFRLKTPMSPHAAADIDGISISIDDFVVPKVDGNLIIEGAGGLMVPVNNEGVTYLDVFEKWKLPVILVSRHYLGSINHTLLSIDALNNRQIPIEGIIFVGDEHPTTEEIILKSTGVRMIARIPLVDEITPAFVCEQAAKIKGNL